MRLWIEQKRPPNARDWAFGGSLLESNALQWVGEDIEHRALSFFSPCTPVARKVFLWYYEKQKQHNHTLPAGGKKRKCLWITTICKWILLEKYFWSTIKSS
jgi:hypothetical protein